MSLPNSPADPYPEAFGWPWHGLIRRSSKVSPTDPSDDCEIVMAAGIRPMPSGNLIGAPQFTWTHPFVVPGLPEPDMPSDDGMTWLSRGIRRESGQWYWGREGLVPCVRGMIPWSITDFWYANDGAGGQRAAARVRDINGDERYIYSEYLGADPFGAPSELDPSAVRTRLMMHGGSGDRRLLLCSYNHRITDALVRVGIIEVVVEPELERLSVVIHADYADMHSVISSTTSPGAPSYTIYYFAVGAPVVQGYGDPPPPGAVSSESYSVGSQSYSREEQYLFWAWYADDGTTVELVRLNHAYSASRSFSYGVSRLGFEDTTDVHTFSIQGSEVLSYTLNIRSDFNNNLPYTQSPSGSLVIQGDELPLGMTTSTGNYRPPALRPGPASALPFVDDYIDGPVGVALPGPATSNLLLQVAFLSNALITMGYSANVLGEGRRCQGSARSPSGPDAGTYLLTNTGSLTQDELLCWNSGAWNPVTGAVRRANIDYRYNWV